MAEIVTDCCAICRRPIEQPGTGRRRLTCSDRCRAQLARDRRHRKLHDTPSRAETARNSHRRRITPAASQNG